MPGGYPCCCVAVSGGTWDLYNINFSPFVLDMASTLTLNFVSDFANIEENYFTDLPDNARSFRANSLGGFVTNLHELTPDPWFIEQLSYLNSGSISRDYLNGDRYNINSTHIDFNGTINLRTDPETVVQFNTQVTTGVLETTSNWLTTGFNVYLDEYSSRNLDQFFSPFSANSNFARIVQNFYRHRAEAGFLCLESPTFSNFELPAFNLTGEYGGAGPVIYSRTYTHYEWNGNPTETEKFRDIFGVGDEYPGTTANYNTGTFRYSLDQPFFTGTTVYIQHSIDLPASLFSPSTEGYKTEYSGLPSGGIYVALYGYYTGSLPLLTGIHSTGTQDFYVNSNKNQMVIAPKLAPPLVAEFSLNESYIDSRRNGRNLPQDHSIMRLDLVIKPDEARSFMITWNERTVDVGSTHYRLKQTDSDSPTLDNGTFLHFDLNGRVYQDIRYRTPGLLQSVVTVQPFSAYTIDDSGFYHITLYRDYQNEIDNKQLFTDDLVFNNFPEMTGEPACPPSAFDPADDAAYVSQCKNNYTDLYNKFNAASGYLPYDSLQERALYIYPFNRVYENLADGGNQPVGYLGSSGDGFYLKDARVSLYSKEYYNAVVKTLPANSSRSWVSNTFNQITDNSKSSALGLDSSGIGLFNSKFRYFPLSVISYDKNTVNLSTVNLHSTNSSNDEYRQYKFIPTYLEGFYGYNNQITVGRGLNEIYTTGTSITSPNFTTISGSFYQDMFLTQYNVNSNTVDVMGIHDLNLDSFHYSDKLAKLDGAALNNNSGILPALISHQEQKALVLLPDTSCWPILYSIGDSTTDIKDVSGISYNYYLSSDFNVQSINKFNRGGSGITADLLYSGIVDENNASSLNLNDSYHSVNYAVPTANTLMGTTTIIRPTGGPGAQTGNFTLTDDEYVSGIYDTQDENLWVYPIFYDITDTIQLNEFGDPLPHTGGSSRFILRPKFIDGFVAHQSPFIAASGWQEDTDPVVVLNTTTLADPTGGSATAFIDYVDYTIGPFTQNGYLNENSWTPISQAQVRTYPYQYSVYGDNYAFHWVETVNDVGDQLYSFKVNGNYVFQNVPNLTPDQLEFKVGPNNLVYILKGSLSGTTYTKYGQVFDSDGNMVWLDYVRNSAGNVLDPPTLSGVPPVAWKLQVTDLNANNINSLSMTSYLVPQIIGMTDEHFYVAQLVMNTLPDLFFINNASVLTEVQPAPLPFKIGTFDASNNPVDTYKVLFNYNEPRRPNEYWRIDYNLNYYSPLYPYDNALDAFNGIDLDLPLSSTNTSTPGVLRSNAENLEFIMDKLMITNNTSISGTPLASENDILNWKTIDYTVNSHVWNAGISEYENDYNFLTGNNWTPGTDVYIDINEIRLTGGFSGFVGNDVAIYKHLPVEVGKTYALQLDLSTDVTMTEGDGHTLPIERFDIYITHSGVVGQDGKEVQARSLYFESACDRFGFYDGMNDTASNLPDSPLDKMKFIYTPTVVSGTGYNPLIIKVTSSEQSTFNWNKTTEPRFLAIQAMTFHEGITTDLLPNLTGNTIPTIKEYQVV